MEKIALNALKKRQLVKSLGLIPQQGSAWQWALRQLRAPSKKGGKLLLEGKALSKAKEKIGILPNNLKQKLLAAHRKGKLGQEMGLSSTGKVIDGIKGAVNPQGAKILAHTHPSMNRMLHVGEGNKRLLNPVLYASPSGMSPLIKPLELPIKDNLMKRLEVFTNKINKKMEGIDPSASREWSNKYAHLLKRKFQGRDLLTEKIFKLGPFPSDDLAILSQNKNIHNILAPKTTGIHKFRAKSPQGVRSVYFKGGLGE